MTLAVLVLVLCTSTLFAQQQPGVQLEGVPEPFRLPLPEGANKVMTAQLTEGATRSGWISPVGRPGVRVMLKPAGEGVFRINLASKTLYGVLNGLDANAFRVHLKTKEGDIVRSMQVTFAEGSSGDVELSARLLPLNRKDKTVTVENCQWFRPGEYRALRVRPKNLPDGGKLTAKIGEQSVKMSSLTNNRYEMRLNETIRKRWRKHTNLEIRAHWNDRSVGRMCLKARPAQLVTEGESRTFTVRQRAYIELPGSNGLFMMSLGDITRGQVVVDVRSKARDDHQLVDSKSLNQEDHVNFDYRGQTYRLELEKLMNALIGEDHAEFILSRAESDDD